jgi:hypothetical protein
MALLDFIKNRMARPQQADAPKPQQSKPETAKQMYTREAAQPASQRSLAQLPPEQFQQVSEIRARLERATQHAGQDSPARQASHGDAPVSQEAMRQNMRAQNKTAPSMSPTSAQAGMTSVESGASLRPTPTPKVQQKTTQRPQQTIARRPPSWER